MAYEGMNQVDLDLQGMVVVWLREYKERAGGSSEVLWHRDHRSSVHGLWSLCCGTQPICGGGTEVTCASVYRLSAQWDLRTVAPREI